MPARHGSNPAPKDVERWRAIGTPRSSPYLITNHLMFPAILQQSRSLISMREVDTDADSFAFITFNLDLSSMLANDSSDN